MSVCYISASGTRVWFPLMLSRFGGTMPSSSNLTPPLLPYLQAVFPQRELPWIRDHQSLELAVLKTYALIHEYFSP